MVSLFDDPQFFDTHSAGHEVLATRVPAPWPCFTKALLIAASRCRSELARDELKNAAFILTPRIIVNDHREQSSLLQEQDQVANR
ncbi:hypothetical protein PSJE_05340 [Pseudomonas jessenii]|nr:hypothetical protein PSJE_05340 [Pseudomonas jessenii]